MPTEIRPERLLSIIGRVLDNELTLDDTGIYIINKIKVEIHQEQDRNKYMRNYNKKHPELKTQRQQRDDERARKGICIRCLLKKRDKDGFRFCRRCRNKKIMRMQK